MSTNIKNPETHKAIQELARVLGVSQTQAVDRAVREKLWSMRREAMIQTELEALSKIARASAERFTDAEKIFDWDNYLYDEHGLPK